MSGPAGPPAARGRDAIGAKPPLSVSSLVAGVLSSFAIVLVAMMFVTGVAQRAAIPRMKALVARFGEAPADAPPRAGDARAEATGAEARTTAAAWTPQIDSLALYRAQIEIAREEIDASRADPAPARARAAATESKGDGASVDSTARRDLVRLVKVLDAMEPAAAARLLNSADDGLAIEAIRRLRERQAGRVLALLSAEKAAAVRLALGRGAERVP